MAKPYIAQSSSSSYTFTWILSALLVVVFALALAVFPPVFGPIKESHDTAKWLLFFGRFHPLVVHLPIGLLLFSLLIELGCLRGSVEEKWGDAALLTIFISATGAVVGVVFGILLTREGGYEGGAFLLHQGLGIATAVGAIAALFLRLSAMSSGGRGLMETYRFLLLATFGLMSIGAHFGGNMVHGSKYLTQYAPDAMAESMTGFEKWLVGLVEKKAPKIEVPATAPAVAVVETTAAPSPDAVKPGATDASTPPSATPPTAAPPAVATPAGAGPLVFQDVILPVLEAKCNKCHNADKSKGDLRMDTYEMLVKGGQDTDIKCVVPGKPDDSLMIKRIALPNDDDEHMPPDGKDQTTKEELAVLKWWIQEGASSTLAVKDAKFPADLQATVDGVLKK